MLRLRSHLWAGLAVFYVASFVSVLAQPAPAPSQQAGQPPDSPAYMAGDSLFQQVLQNPVNPEINLAFARRAIAFGDYEAAIATLERLLMVKADLPLIRLELGMLYMRLESVSQAQAYLNQALASPKLPPAARKRAEELRIVAEKAARPFKFDYSVSVGIKHQSNANAGPANARIDWPGDIPVLLDNADLKKSDSQNFVSGRANFTLDLAGLRNHQFDIGLTAFSARQNRLKYLDIDFYALQTRALLDIGGAYNLNFSPFIRSDVLNVGTLDNYATTHTMGATLSGVYKNNYPLSLTAQYGYRKHKNRAGNQVNSQQDGGRHAVNMQLGRNFTNGTYLGLSTSYAITQARHMAGHKAYNSISAALSYRYNVAVLARQINMPVLLVAGIGYQKAKYQAPDRITHPDKTRRDRDNRANIGLIITPRKTLQLLLQYNHVTRTSRALRNNYKDNAITLTLTQRF